MVNENTKVDLLNIKKKNRAELHAIYINKYEIRKTLNRYNFQISNSIPKSTNSFHMTSRLRAQLM